MNERMKAKRLNHKNHWHWPRTYSIYIRYFVCFLALILSLLHVFAIIRMVVVGSFIFGTLCSCAALCLTLVCFRKYLFAFFWSIKMKKKIIVFETSTAEKTEFNHVYDNGYAATIARTAFLIEPILYQDNKRMMLFAKSLVIITGCSSQYQASRQPILSQ